MNQLTVSASTQKVVTKLIEHETDEHEHDKDVQQEDDIIIEMQTTTLETLQHLCNQSLNFTVSRLNLSSTITII